MDGPASQLAVDASSLWDAVVIGAGPAGSLAALLLARHGLRTLLVERKRLPRDKVCGGCLSASGVATLHRAHADAALASAAPSPLAWLQLRTPHRSAQLKLPAGVVLDRSRFDAALTQAAVDAGATLLAEVSGSIEPRWEENARQVRLIDRDRRAVCVRARIVLACDGLGAPSARRLPGLAAEAAPTSRVGLGAVFSRGADDVPAHCICMAVGAGGYVGQARLSDGRVALAAAVDPAELRLAGPAETLRRILRACHAPSPPAGAALQVFGAPGLTRTPQRVASPGVLLVGDACGYVEPFTGEGMALALETAAHAVPLAMEVVRRGWTTPDESTWSRIVRCVCGPRRTFCRGVSAVCRHPWLAEAAVTTAALAPAAVMTFTRWMQRTPRSLRG